jgi:hypothetical protein
MKLMKLRIGTGLGLLLFMATAACGPVEMNRARTSDGGDITLASLAGKFASKGQRILHALLSSESFSAGRLHLIAAPGGAIQCDRGYA